MPVDPHRRTPTYEEWMKARGGTPGGTEGSGGPGSIQHASGAQGPVYSTPGGDQTLGDAWREYQSSGTERAPDVRIGVINGRKSKVTIHLVPGPVRHKGDPKVDAAKGKVAAPPSGGVATTLSSRPHENVLPLTGTYDPDFRYQGKMPDTHSHLPPFPIGSVCLVTEATDEQAQKDLLVWADPRLIAANRGISKQHAQYGTNVCDIDGIGAFDTMRVARLQTAWRVLRTPFGSLSLQTNRENSLSWTIGLTGKGEAVGGFVTDGPEPLPVHAMVNARMGGPFDVGYETDKFRIGTTGDNRPINALGFSTTTIFRAPPSWGRDGPILFENADWRSDASSGTAPQECYLVWDPKATYTLPRDGGPGSKAFSGMYRIITFGTIEEITPEDDPPPPPYDIPRDPPPPSDPPPPPPTTGGGGGGATTGDGKAPVGDGRPGFQPGTPGTNMPPPPGGNGNTGGTFTQQSLNGSSDRNQFPAVAAAMTELMLGPVSARPQPLGDTFPDWAHMKRPDESDLRRYNVTSPVTAVATPFGEQSGQDFVLTQRPGSSRYPGGTASGGWFHSVPEVGPLDAASGFAPDGVSRSSSYHVYGPGVSTVHGTIDPDTGTVDDGVRVTRNAPGKIQIDVLVAGVWTTVATVDQSEIVVKSGASVKLEDGVNLKVGAVTGSKIAENATDKVSFHGATPVVQSTGYTATVTGTTKSISDTSSLNEVLQYLAQQQIDFKAKGLIG